LLAPFGRLNVALQGVQTRHLGAVSLLGIGIAHSARAATTWIFDYTDTEVVWSAPSIGGYDITAYGAQGGGNVAFRGGLGAEVGGSVARCDGDSFGLSCLIVAAMPDLGEAPS
jgi:hypothetical protein